MLILYIAMAAVSLAVNILISNEFKQIANYKGYEEPKIFWYCFLFGLVGYLMVIALPDRERRSTPAVPSAVFSSKHRWACKGCGKINEGEKDCCDNCGKHR